MSDLSAMDGLEPLGAKILVLSIESNEYFIQSLQTVKRFVEDTSYGFYSLTNEVKPRRRRMQSKNSRETLFFVFVFINLDRMTGVSCQWCEIKTYSNC